MNVKPENTVSDLNDIRRRYHHAIRRIKRGGYNDKQAKVLI